MEETTFHKGNDRLDELLAKPGTQERVAKVREENKNNDRAYKMRLAMIRDAAMP